MNYQIHYTDKQGKKFLCNALCENIDEAIKISLILAPHLHEGKAEPLITGDNPKLVELDNGMLHIKKMKSLKERSV